MKQVNLVATFNVPDDYEIGKCDKCPLCAKSRFETHQYIKEDRICKIGFTSLTCPLIEKHINRADTRGEEVPARKGISEIHVRPEE